MKNYIIGIVIMMFIFTGIAVGAVADGSEISYIVELGVGMDNTMVWTDVTADCQLVIVDGVVTEIHQYFARKALQHWAFDTFDNRRGEFIIDMTQTTALRYRVRVSIKVGDQVWKDTEGNIIYGVSEPVFTMSESWRGSVIRVYESLLDI